MLHSRLGHHLFRERHEPGRSHPMDPRDRGHEQQPHGQPGQRDRRRAQEPGGRARLVRLLEGLTQAARGRRRGLAQGFSRQLVDVGGRQGDDPSAADRDERRAFEQLRLDRLGDPVRQQVVEHPFGAHGPFSGSSPEHACPEHQDGSVEEAEGDDFAGRLGGDDRREGALDP